MKKFVKSSNKIGRTPIRATSYDYTDSWVEWVGNYRYGIRSKYTDDPYNFQCYITEIHPYDDAEYCWIRKDMPNSASVYRNGRKIDTITLADWDDYEDEYEGDAQDFIHDMVVGLCEELRECNRGIKSVMVYNW